MKHGTTRTKRLLSILLSLALILGLMPGMGLTAYAAPAETLLTTITPTGITTYSESTAGVVNVTLSNISRYSDGKWMYGGTVTVTPVMGYTITKCRFNARRGAVDDTEAPFSINVRDATHVGTVEVYGYATPTATHSVTITAGDHMTKTAGSGDAEQTGLTGAMTDVVYAANDGYYFPENYSVAAVNGISVTRDSYTQITVSGTPTADAAIALTAPTAKTTPAAPTTAAAVDCTTSDNNDGKLTGVTTAMEYKKLDADSWTDGTGSDITGLVPGTYYVRLKETDTANASANQELTIAGYTAPTHTHAWATAWTHDATYHWHACTGEGATDACLNETGAAKAAHTYGDTGDARFTCTVCEYVDTTKQAEAELADAKTAAKADLDTLLDGKTEADYDADDWAALNQAITDGKAAIDNATTIDDVATAKSNAETAANTVKTTAEKLADAKTAAKADLDTLLAGKTEADYDADDWAALNQAITDGKAAIDNATTIDDVATAKSNAETAANAVKTTAEKKEEADTAAANGVSDTINNLPAANEVTTANKNAIEAARAAYNALTDDQKAKVSADTLKKLTDAEEKLVVLQVMSEVSAKTGSAATYTGNPSQLINTPTTALPTGYTMKYAVTTENTAPDASAYTTEIPTAADAGTYYVWYKAAGDDNHNDSQPACVAVTIAQVSITEAAVKAEPDSFDYDGQEKAPQITVTWNGKVLEAGKDYTLSGDTTAKDFGTYTVTVTGKGNFKDAVTTTWNIAGKQEANTSTETDDAGRTITGAVNVSPDTPATTATVTTDFAKAQLDGTEPAGAKVDVYLEVEKQEAADVNAGNKTALENQTAGKDNSGVSMFLDLNLYKKVGSAAAEEIAASAAPVTVTMTVPAAMRMATPGYNRTFSVYCSVNGAAAQLVSLPYSYNAATGQITFNASQFDTATQNVTYALVYTDTPKNGGSFIILPNGYGVGVAGAAVKTGVKSANTGDSGISLYVALLGVSAILGAAVIGDNKRRRSN